MLGLKKKADSANDQVPPWHPNFRNYQQLPDIKVVRTAFFVNGTAAFVALALLVLFVLRESELRGLNSNIDLFQKQIDSDTPASNEAKANYKKFQDQEKRIKEVQTFIASKPVMSDLLLQLGATRPKNIALDYVEIRAPDNTPPTAPTILIRGNVRGSAGQANDEANAYVEVLRNDPVLGPRLESSSEGVMLRASAPDPATQTLKIEIGMKFKSAVTAAKKP